MSLVFPETLISLFAGAGSFILELLALSWWLWAFVILVPIAVSAWFFWRKSTFKKKIDWMVLEIKMPREVKKNPKAMEQVLNAIYSMRNAPGTITEKWWDGETTRWYSLEMVSFGGETHFYVRLYRKQQSLMEAAFLSYYPDIELVEVDDYTGRLPDNIGEMYKQGYDIWGSDIVLSREDAYPIKTYPQFEAPEEEKQYDTMSSFLELFSSLKREEIMALQIIIAPTDMDWWKKWEGLLKELSTKQEGKGKLSTSVTFPTEHFIGILPKFEVVHPGKDEMGFLKTAFRTPGETDVLKAVENNLSKLAFKTLMRLVYLSPKSMFSDAVPRRGMMGVLNQFSSLSMNSLKFNLKTAPGTPKVLMLNSPYIFPKIRNEYRKARLLYNYVNRKIPEELFMGEVLTSNIFNWNTHSKRFEMNTECIATIFHPPTYLALTAPHIARVESRKGGPPAGLAIFGGEENVEKLK